MNRRLMRWAGQALLLLAAAAAAAQTAAVAARRPPPPPPDAPAPAVPAASAVPAAPVSLSARKVYEQARSQLVQIRTVLKGQASQTSVGSGFLVTGAGPHRHQLPRRQRGGAEAGAPRPRLRHRRRPRGAAADPADRRAARPGAAEGRRRRRAQLRRAAVPPGRAEPLAQGERIYSLGNPLDVGFAVTQGTYNGLVRRSFYPQIFFGGALSGRHERRPRARRGRPRRRHQRRAPGRRRAGELPGAGRVRRAPCWRAAAMPSRSTAPAYADPRRAAAAGTRRC